MSLRARCFVDSWITKNVRTGPGDSKELALRLLIEANALGIPPTEITMECGDPKATIESALGGIGLNLSGGGQGAHTVAHVVFPEE